MPTILACCLYSCPCGKLYSGEEKRCEKLMKLHHKICKRGQGGTDTSTVTTRINKFNPKSQDGEKIYQKKIQVGQKKINLSEINWSR